MKNPSLIKGISLFAIILIISSCGQLNIQKRQYSGGWTIFSGKGVKSDPLPERQHRKPQNAQTAANLTREIPEAFAAELPEMYPAPESTLDEAPAATPSFIQKQLLKKADKKISRMLLNNTGPDAKAGKYAVLKKKNAFQAAAKGGDTDILIIVLCFLLPPVAVYMYEGNTWTNRCTLNLILTLLCGIPGVIHALIVVLGGK